MDYLVEIQYHVMYFVILLILVKNLAGLLCFISRGVKEILTKQVVQTYAEMSPGED